MEIEIDMHVQARAGAAMQPAALAQSVVNHKALDAVSADAQKAAANTASAQAEGRKASKQ